MVIDAICTIGTTSGPMHLASMMGCPVVTWQHDYEKMWYRFSSAWNPNDSNLILIKNSYISSSRIIEDIIVTVS